MKKKKHTTGLAFFFFSWPFFGIILGMAQTIWELLDLLLVYGSMITHYANRNHFKTEPCICSSNK